MSPKDATKLRRREVPAAPLAGASGGEMGRLIQTKDWSGTPLGPLETWPQSQKTAVNLVLNSQHPMWLGWGPECTFLYNDAYLQVLGAAKHPWALGRPAAEVWAEIWDVCGPLARKVFQAGEASFVDHVRLFLKRDGYLEETFYSFSYSPIYDESGQVAGLFCPSNEITDRLLTERRLKTLSELAARAYLEKTTDAACHSAITTIAKNPADIPFALLYLTDPAHPSVTLKGAVGVPRGDPEISPEIVDVSHPGSCAWPLDPVLGTATGRVVPVDSYSILPIGLAQQRLKEALVIPVSAAGQEHPVGLLVVGVSPGRPLDREYRTFFELVAGQVGTAILSARAAEEEKRRAEELAKLDKEKTAFFSNVSHEFRTPLTLLLGPMEEALRSPGHSLSGEQLEAAHRNAVRLLKLVNTLLDFSRIEAGRLDARFERVDLGRVTRELTGIFRSAVERAGLRFTVDIPDLDSDVYVDPTMWEKIVLNLLSNALKFTFEGEIAVRLRAEGSKVVLEIADTGIGIPGTELSRIFERFHRVQGARSRTHEGSGIGLALVQELVRMHGGTISAQSTVGKGTTFRVELATGKAHLPSGVGEGPARRELGSAGPPAFLAEAVSWSKTPSASAVPPSSKTPARILLADDNSDMRDYVQRLLQGRWTVEAVGDGVQALARAREQPPDLILTDVMMPGLDG
ncbi:MAG TPA: ATP-binding protein, partial [Planctomycetota bacterium]|nr:ATP-binding protein [Planctomycetota bacterium]